MSKIMPLATYGILNAYFTNTNAIIPVSSRGVKKILSFVIASPLGGEAIPYEKVEIAASLHSSQ
jgi:hypothetical protein